MSDRFSAVPAPGGPPQGPMPGMGAPGGAPMGAPGLGSVPTGGGLLRVVSGSQLDAQDKSAREAKERMIREISDPDALDELTAYVRKQFDIMRRHRDGSTGWTDRLLRAMRMFNGVYDPQQLSAIQEFGGSEVYARIVAVKCRGATSLLRDIYLQQTRPWDIAPTPKPDIPDDKREEVDKLLEAETQLATMNASPESGPPPTEEQIAERKVILDTMLGETVLKKSREEAREAFRYLDDLLIEGGFYKALAEFLVDLPLFPFACIRGPVVYVVPTLKWEKNAQGVAKAVKKPEPRMFWRRVSPFDVWWSPGASQIEGTDLIYRERKSRSDINAMLGVPGYKDDNIRKVLDTYTRGYTESPDSADSTRADLEKRENPHLNETGMFDCMEFNGSVPGRLLKAFGLGKKEVPDETRDYAVQLWFIGTYVIKAQLAPSPRDRAPFYITSFDKVPGTLIGNAIPDVLSDIQDVCNATLRALVNNLALSSGPMVGVDDEQLANTEDSSSIFPWKVWKFSRRPGVQATQPITFFQPQSNAQSLLAVYEKFTQIADEVSAIPRYITGSERMGGAGRTASGLAMLMGNASKILQTVAGNIDRDVFEPLLQQLYDIIMLTDRTGRLRGDENVSVKGVTVAIQRETERARQIEMLQATANPIDAQIVGLRGRGALLRSIATTMGLDGEVIVPSDDELAAREKMAQAAAVAQAQAPAPGAPGAGGGPGAPPGGPGGGPPAGGPPGAPQGTPGNQPPQPGPTQGPSTNLVQ